MYFDIYFDGYFFVILRKRKCGKNCGSIDKYHKQTKTK